jgi:hypothetical protein
MSYRRREHPSLEQLWDAPELASLAILEVAADTAALALEAVHPEMQDRDRDPNDESEALRAAINVIQLAQTFGSAVGRYRLALRRAHRHEDDIPW